MPVYRKGSQYKVGEPLPEKERFSWDEVDIRPNSLAHLTTGGWVNMFDHPDLSRVKWVKTNRLHPTDSNPLRHYRMIDRMVEDFQNNDLSYFVPILVEEGGTSIVDGHHRWWAAKEADIEKVPIQELYRYGR